MRAAGLFKEEQRQCSPYTSSRDRRGQAVRFIGTDENVACSGNLAAAFSTVSVRGSSEQPASPVITWQSQ